ncbi:MAG: hypothetical protein H6619_05740 [Deltaproteobacteria bacterium]|nr:hypothetical protein [Deltaproteobacteria bacterium]
MNISSFRVAGTNQTEPSNNADFSKLVHKNAKLRFENILKDSMAEKFSDLPNVSDARKRNFYNQSMNLFDKVMKSYYQDLRALYNKMPNISAESFPRVRNYIQELQDVLKNNIARILNR